MSTKWRANVTSGRRSPRYVSLSDHMWVKYAVKHFRPIGSIKTQSLDDRVFPFHSSTCPKNTSWPTCVPSCWTSAPIDLQTWVRALTGCYSLSSCLWIPKVSSCCCKPSMSSLLGGIGLLERKAGFQTAPALRCSFPGRVYTPAAKLLFFENQLLREPPLSFSASEPLAFAVALRAFRHTRENSSEEYLPPRQPHWRLNIALT